MRRDGRPLRFIVGRDTRESGEWIERELARGVRSEGAHTHDAPACIPTPAIAYVTREMAFDAGIVISASHNPFQDNGIKVFSGRGEKFTETLERAGRSDRRRRELDGRRIRRRAGRAHRRDRRLHRACAAGAARSAAARAASSIAVDTANGATTTVAPRLFDELGFDVAPAERRARRPQHQSRLRLDASRDAGCASVVERGCRLGVAFDGDGDRAILVDAERPASSTATPCC